MEDEDVLLPPWITLMLESEGRGVASLVLIAWSLSLTMLSTVDRELSLREPAGTVDRTMRSLTFRMASRSSFVNFFGVLSGMKVRLAVAEGREGWPESSFPSARSCLAFDRRGLEEPFRKLSLGR